MTPWQILWRMTTYAASLYASLLVTAMPDGWCENIGNITIEAALGQSPYNVKLSMQVEASIEDEAQRSVLTHVAFLQSLLRICINTTLENIGPVCLSSGGLGSLAQDASADVAASEDFKAKVTILRGDIIRTAAIKPFFMNPIISGQNPGVVVLAGKALQHSYEADIPAERLLLAWLGVEVLGGLLAGGEVPTNCPECKRPKFPKALHKIRTILQQIYSKHPKHPNFSNYSIENFINPIYNKRNLIMHEGRSDLLPSAEAQHAQALLADFIEETLRITLNERHYRVFQYLKVSSK
jgi:hypothetical protein